MKNDSLLLGFLLCFLSLMATGCTQKMEETKKIIRYAGYAFPEYDRFRKEEAKKFEKLHPDVIVKYEPIPGQGYRGKILTEIAGGTIQDIFFVDIGYFDFVEKGVLLDLSPYVEKDKEYFQQIYPVLMDFHHYKGGIYGLPGNANTDVIFFNKRLFDEIGLSYPDEKWTWDTMLEGGKKLTRKDERGINSHFGIIGLNWMTLMKQSGGELWDKDRSRCIINSVVNRQAIEYLRDLSLKHRVSPTLADAKEQGSWQIFMAGRGGMFCGGRWYTTMLKQNKNLDWGIAVLPKNKNRASRLTFNTFGISVTTKHPQLSYELVKFLIRPEGIKFLVDAGDSIPIRWTEEDNLYFLSDLTRPKDENQIYMETMKEVYTQKDFFHPQVSFEEQEEILRQEMEEFMLAKTNAEESLGKMEKKLNKMLAEK